MRKFGALGLSPGLTAGVFSFLLTVSQVSPFTAGPMAPGWVLLTFALPFLVGPVRMGLPHWMGIGFLFAAAISAQWAPAPGEALWHLGVIAGCFCLGSATDDLRPIWRGLALGVGVSSAVCIAQVFGFDWVAQSDPPAGLFVNKLILGWLAGLVLVAVISEGMWWYAAAVFPAFLLTTVRAAVLAVGIAFVIATWRRSRIAAIMLALGIALMATVVLVGQYRQTSTTEHGNIVADTVDHLSLRGRGIGSFVWVYPRITTRLDASRWRPEHAHNDFAELAFEVGAGALPLFAMILILLHGPISTERLVFIAFLVEAAFGFPLFHPATAFVGALVAGWLAGRWCLVRGPRDRGRSALPRGRPESGLGWFPTGRATIP